MTVSVMPETKFVPVTVTIPAGEFTRTSEGPRVETVGSGLSTSTLLLASAATTSVPFATASLRIAPVCSSEAGIVAWISVLLIYVVWMGTPESWMTVLEVNPVPVTTIVTADEPTRTFLGETDEIASGPPREDDPELTGAPPHPERRARKRQRDKTRRAKLKGPAVLEFIWSAQIIRTQVSGQAKK